MSDIPASRAVGHRHIVPSGQFWRVVIPIGIALILAVIPPPAGLTQYAWYDFAVFSGVIAALITEPLPNPAVGVIGLSLTAALSRWLLFAPADQAKAGFSITSQTIAWALSGFSSTTVWLVGAAFMFALGYQKTGLGRRIALLLVRRLGRNTLSLGYATTFAETLLAPFTPSNTARGAGIMFPIVSNLPGLFDSKPNDPSARKIGGYIMWTSFAADCVTSTLFLTACAPNFLAISFIDKIAHVHITFGAWMAASLPFALPLLLVLPLLAYGLYPPQIRRSAEASNWAARELETMGGISRRELTLAAIVLAAILMWVFGGNLLDPALTAFCGIALMLVLGVVTWDDMAKNDAAWTTITLLATLVTLADGLAKCGFIKWFAAFVAAHVGGMSPTLMIMALVAIYYFSHYMFASLTAHTTAMMPLMLAAAVSIPGMPVATVALALALTTGLMGVISPYATGPALPYYNSGYIPPAVFWRLGAIFGLVFVGALLLVGVPLMMRGW